MREIPAASRYAAALLFSLIALGARALAGRWLGPLQPYASGWVAIAASVWFFGWGPALLSAVVSFVGGTFLFIVPAFGPRSWMTVQEIAAAATYGLSAGLLIAIGHRARLAERRLADANEELRAADRKKDEFLATLSHELRNPVSVITSAVAVLESTPHDPRAGSTIAIVSRQSAQIRRLVEDLLDVGRITRGRLVLRPQTVDLRRCVEHAIEANQQQMTVKQQTIVAPAAGGPVLATVDEVRIIQVLSNLIDNASKYSPKGAEVVVRLRDGDADLCIDVSDNGPGIDPIVMPHLFDLFDQGGTSGSGGLGLGLGLCKRLVEMHGGTISAAPNPDGRGTTFTVQLPREAARVQAGDSASA
jgi:signal transduction histidine kinase